MFTLTPVGGSPTAIKVASDRITKKNGRQHVVKLNYKRKTMIDLGSKFLSWSGDIMFDELSERDYIRDRYLDRTFYLTENLDGGSPVTVLVLWVGGFHPKYTDTIEIAGFVPFQFEEV